MKHDFDNYSIVTDGSKTFICYLRNRKDWIDLIRKGVLAIVCVFFFCFGVYSLLGDEIKWYHYLVLGVIVLANVFFIADFVINLIQPAGEIISVNKTKNEVSIKRLFGRIQRIELSNCRQIEYAVYEDFVRLSGNAAHGKFRYRTEVYLVTHQGEKIHLLTINPSQIIDPGYGETKEILIKKSKNIVKTLAEKMGILSQWNGIIKEKKINN